MPIIRRTDCVPLPIVVCPVVAVVMLDSWVARCMHYSAGESGGKLCALCGECCLTQATFSTQCTHPSTQLSSITTATTGQTTIGSGTQSDLLMMGIKMPETCWDTIDYQ